MHCSLQSDVIKGLFWQCKYICKFLSMSCTAFYNVQYNVCAASTPHTYVQTPTSVIKNNNWKETLLKHSVGGGCEQAVLVWLWVEKPIALLKITAHKEMQVSFCNIQKSSVCFVCPQLDTVQHTTNLRIN